MKIGNVIIEGFAALAPMAGVADRAMREICREYGAAYTVGELTSAKGVSMGDKKSEKFLSVHSAERPMASQIFGCDPAVMAAAAKTALKYLPDFIDINMGCPAPKVALNGGGSALMKDVRLAAETVKAVVKAVDLPVTVKMRTGWNENSINAVELALRCEDAGAAAVTVHGRTREQMYSGKADYETIAKVKAAVSIPVIANGDIVSAKTAETVYKETNCDCVMIGRAAMGNPFIFREIEHYFKTGEELPPPTPEEKLEVLKRQVKLMLLYKDERNAILESRKHTAWYLKGFRGAAGFRRECGEINSFSNIEKICEKALAEYYKI